MIPKKEEWIWVDRKNHNGMATSNSRSDSLFIGINNVNFQNTSDICVKGKLNKIVKVKMTTCLTGNQFTCDDGICISMDKRCDQSINCNDGSDELNCAMIEMGNNYNSKISPFKFDDALNKVIPASVSASIKILDIIKIGEVDNLFTMKFVFIMEWYDYRLRFHNLKRKRSSNALTYNEVKKIWIPNLIFSNTQKNEGTVGTKASVLTITREGNYTRSESHILEETNIFEGRENKITFALAYTKLFQCKYQLSMYPFDTQACTADITVKKFERQALKVMPKDIEMLGNVELTQYLVTSWKLQPKIGSEMGSEIQVILQLKRRIVSQLLTSFLPTMIILFIVYCTNYFKMQHFNTALTINLTSMLVLTTLFIGVSNSLPKVAYVKVCISSTCL